MEFHGDANLEYLSDGLTDALRGSLSQVGSLEVKSAAAVRRYRHSDKSGREMARELGVDGLIEGSVTARGSQLQIVVGVIDGETDDRIWTKEYPRDLSNLVNLGTEVARDIAATFTDVPAFNGAPDQPPPRRLKPEAFLAYAQAMYLRRRAQLGGCRDAVPLFEKAIALEPRFADAYANLAWCYAMPARAGVPASVAGPKAREAAGQALALDSRSAMPHVVLGLVRHRIDYDWTGAERELRQALAANPQDPDALVNYGEYLYATGRDDEAIAHVRRSLELEPLNLDRRVAFGYALLHVGRYHDAIREFEGTLALDANWATAHLFLTEGHEALGQRDRAVAAYIGWLVQTLRPERITPAIEDLKAQYAQRGWHAFWRTELALCEQVARAPGSVWRARTCSPIAMAVRYARLGDADAALAALDQSYEQRHPEMVFIHRAAVFESLRDHPGFRNLRRRIGIPEGL
jgi:TolB-like protein/thioredoxin-like negative regulator of GroEL